MQGLAIVLTAIAYVSLLFAIASLGDRARRRRGGGKPRPYIYALSLAIYCTSWTFFGSVGLASERGLGIPGDLYRPAARLPVRLPAAAAHHPARQGREDHLDRRLPRRALRQELSRRLDRHADRHGRRGALHRAAAQGDLRLGQPDGRALFAARRSPSIRSSATSR